MPNTHDATITEGEILDSLSGVGHDPSAHDIEDVLAKLDTAAINSAPDRSQALREAVSTLIQEGSKAAPITIRLPKRPESKAVDELFATFPRNPIDSRQVVVFAEVNGTEEAVAVVSAYPDLDGGMHLSEIITMETGKGYGTAALKAILDIADRHNESMHLVAKKIGTNKTMLSTTALRDWYARHGFEVCGGSKGDGYDMTRLPRPELVKDATSEEGLTP